MQKLLLTLAVIGIFSIGLMGCASTEGGRSQSMVGEGPASRERVYDVGAVTTLPRAEFQSRPNYPLELRKAGIGGEGVVVFTIRTDGRVDDVAVVSATDPRFGLAAAEAVKSWRFQPAQLNGRPVPCRMQVPIVFAVDQR